MKSSEAREVIYTCRYYSGQLAELYVLKMSTRISAGVDDFPCFTTFYYYDPY